MNKVSELKSSIYVCTLVLGLLIATSGCGNFTASDTDSNGLRRFCPGPPMERVGPNYNRPPRTVSIELDK